MSRAYTVFGEFLLYVSGGRVGGKEELGLSADPFQLLPNYAHRDINSDGLGAIPVEVMWNMTDAMLRVTLVHYDVDILNKCLCCAQGGGNFDETPGDVDSLDGTMAQNGRLLGNNRGLGTAANMLNTVYLSPTGDSSNQPYRFRACYLNARPLVIPLGTERSLVQLCWRVIPYQSIEVDDDGVMIETSSEGGVVLWDHETDLLLI